MSAPRWPDREAHRAGPFGLLTVLMPDPARALAAHHACADRRFGQALAAEERGSQSGDREAGHDVAADALLRQRRRRFVPERGADRSGTAGARRGAPTRRGGAGCRSARARCRATGRRWAGTPARASPARARLPSRVTRSAGTCSRHVGWPSRTSSTSRSSAARMSSGSNPATTTGSLWRSTNGSNTPQPVMAAAWPAARKPSTRVSGISATISMTGGMYLWADRKNRFGGGLPRTTAAVATAVVSNPVAKKTTGSGAASFASATACATLYTTSIRRAFGLRVGQRPRRPGHPQHVAVGHDADALSREGDRLVDLGLIGDADRTAGPHDHLQVLAETRRAVRSARSPARGCRTRA